MAAVSPTMVRLMQQVCATSGYGADLAEVVGLVTSTSVSPMSEWVDKCHVICHAAHGQYFNVALDN